MALHPQIAQFIANLPAADHGPLDPVAARAAEAAHVPALEDRLPLHQVQDLVASTEAGEVPVRIYTPTESDSFGIVVYLHGGAFFSGSLDTHDATARSLAKASGFKVVSVGYRLAPEHAFPAGLDDSYAVVKWVAEQGEKLQWDGKNLAVAGDSSGGTFTAAISAMAKDEGFDKISHQLLFYPSLDLDFDESRYASLRENATGYGLETWMFKPHNSFYLENGADPADPRVSPIKREDFSGLPKTLVITAEHDPLRDEGELYAERLAKAGVDAQLERFDGANHGFVVNFAWIDEFARVFETAGKFLSE